MRYAISTLIFLAVACGQRAPETASGTDDPGSATPTSGPAVPAAPAGPRVEQDSFVLEAVANAAGYTAGQASTVTIRLLPRGGWHVNQDFPVQVDLHAPAELGLAKAQLLRADAAAFDEQQFRFDAALTPVAAGPRTLGATVNFAICTDENCLPQRVELALPLEVH